MKIDNIKAIFKYLGYIILGLLSLFSIIFIINSIIITEAPFKVAQDNDWISFWGSLLGAIVSGIFTFIALKITIRNENKKRIEDNRLIEIQRLEDRRMEILPYLSYYIVDDKYIEDNKVEKQLKTPLFITPKSSTVGKVSIDCKFNLIIENLGLGVAVEPRIDKIYYDGIKDTQLARNNTTISVGESSVMNFKVVYPNKAVSMMTLTIGYFNLIRDYYEQDVVIDFQGIPVLYKDELGNIEKTKMNYKPVILEIKKPTIIENFEDSYVNIKVSFDK